MTPTVSAPRSLAISAMTGAAPDPVPPSVYRQAVKVLARIDESLALCGSDKRNVLSATIYLADVTQKTEFNRAWDEWVDQANKPARATVEARLATPDYKVEIAGIAAR